MVLTRFQCLPLAVNGPAPGGLVLGVRWSRLVSVDPCLPLDRISHNGLPICEPRA